MYYKSVILFLFALSTLLVFSPLHASHTHKVASDGDSPSSTLNSAQTLVQKEVDMVRIDERVEKC